MDELKLRERLSMGKEASFLLEKLEPHLKEIEKTCISQLKTDFRSNELDEKKALIRVSKLCTIDDIRSKFTTKIKMSEKASKELKNGR